MITSFLHSPLVILAGGRSSRMNFNLKGLLNFHGKLWIYEQIERFQYAGGKKIVFVFGHEFETYLNALQVSIKNEKCWMEYNGISFSFLINPAPELGQFSSFICAAKYFLHEPALFPDHLTRQDMPPEEKISQGIFLLLIDTPAPSKNTWAIIDNFNKQNISAVIPVYKKKKGHPVYLSADFLRKVIPVAPGADYRLDRQIQKLAPDDVHYIDVDDEDIITNLNSMDAWNQYLIKTTNP